jgi:hypothetical protein
MRNRILISLVAVVLVLVGMAGGIIIGGHFTAQAAATQHYTVRSDGSRVSEYCALYEQTLANDLGKDPKTLENANIDALTQVVYDYAKDGKITNFERDQLVALIKQLGVSPCTQLDNSKAIMTYLLQPGNPVVVQALAAHAALTSAVATALNMNADDLVAALAAGKTVPQLAKQHGVEIATVRNAYLSAAKTFLAQDVSKDIITQTQADALNKMLATAVAKDSYPLLDIGNLASLGQ